jgi:ankyrin repeat protein
MVELLLAANADVNVMAHNGSAPIRCVCRKGRPSGRVAGFETVLSWACRTRSDAASVVRLLWKAGADMDALFENETPLQIAIRFGARAAGGGSWCQWVCAGKEHGSVRMDSSTRRRRNGR